MIRLDILLVNKNIAKSRQRAQVYIRNNQIYVNGKCENKCGKKFNEDVKIDFKGDKYKYVSRGGYKLESAILEFNIDLSNKICSDIGASTGGFTDCMIQNGAKLVYAIDVGYDQLDEKLKNSNKVINLEKVNIRYIDKDIFQKVDFISIDVSFISLKLIMDSVKKILKTNGCVVALIKPQFEVGKKFLSRNGIVRDDKIREKVLKDMIKYFESIDFKIKGINKSPIKGGDGNIEYLIYLENS